jgi:uncharacterized protein
MIKNYLPRIIDSVLQEYLDTFGAVYIRGPKWCGKTTTAEKYAKSVIKLQDANHGRDYVKLADIDPSILLQGDYPRLIDEWQLAPTLWDAVRTKVDEENKEGLFILTGSAVPLADHTRHTGTGRISRLLMKPMSLWESNDSNGTISLADLFYAGADVNGITSDLTIEMLASVICRGGWPASVGKSERSAQLISQDYITALCEEDVSRVDGIEKNPKRVKSMLRSYSRNVSTLATNRSILQDIQANDTQISDATLYSYMNALTKLFIIEDVPAWSPAIRSKTAIRSSDKKEFVDPSIATASLGITPSMLMEDMQTLGLLFETLCIRDLRVYSQSIRGNISYYHDRYGLECDCVLHLDDGRYALIEVKLGGRQIEEAASHLLKLKKLIVENKMKEPTFLMVLTGGRLAYRRNDEVYVVPAGCLKN